MPQVDVMQVAFIRPIIDQLEKSGANVHRIMQRSGVDRFDYHDKNNFIPTAIAHLFFEEVARAETGPVIPKEFLDGYKIANMGDWSDYVFSCQDVLSACQNSSRPEARTFSTEDLRLTITGDRAVFFDRFDAKPGLAKYWTDSLLLALIMDGFHCFMGEAWSPGRVYSSAPIENGIESYLDSQTTFIPSTDGCGIEFPSEILTTVLQSHSTEGNGSADGTVMPSSLVAQIECVIDAIQPGQGVTLDRTAVMLDVAPRSLQRQLQELGTTFGDVFDNWRMKKSLRLLFEDRSTISEIAERLHYAQTPNFVRAFRRWTQTTPGQFRADLD